MWCLSDIGPKVLTLFPSANPSSTTQVREQKNDQMLPSGTSHVGKQADTRVGTKQAWIQILIPLRTNCIALDKSLKLLHLENEGFGKDYILPSPCELLGGRWPSPLQPQHPPPIQTPSRYSNIKYLLGLHWMAVMWSSFEIFIFSKPKREEDKQQGNISKW